MKVTKITIVMGHGTDCCLLDVDIPCGVYPFKGNHTLKMEVSADQGEQYCSRHFPGVPIEIVKDRA